MQIKCFKVTGPLKPCLALLAQGMSEKLQTSGGAPRAGLTHSLSRSGGRGGGLGPQELVSCRQELLVQLCVGTPGFLGKNRAHPHPLPVGQGQLPGQPSSVFTWVVYSVTQRDQGADGHHAALGCFRPKL